MNKPVLSLEALNLYGMICAGILYAMPPGLLQTAGSIITALYVGLGWLEHTRYWLKTNAKRKGAQS